MIQNNLTRLWFLAKGCHQVPPDFIGGKILWGHPDGYFLGALGQKLLHDYGPAKRAKQTGRGYCAPYMRQFGNKTCHVLMALAHYGQRPIYIDRHGKPYVGQVHHLINDPLDYKPANLLCWLDRPTHREADGRRRILEREIGDLHQLSYAALRYVQDPRITTREEFDALWPLTEQDKVAELKKKIKELIKKKQN